MATSPDQWVELHCRSNFSFLEGASHPEELIEHAQALGYGALALTDRATIAGMVRAHTEAKKRGFKLIVGAEIQPVDAPPLVLWAPDRAAYGRLCRLLTVGRTNAPKGECRLTFEDVAQFAGGLLAGALLPEKTSPQRSAAKTLRPSSSAALNVVSSEEEAALFRYRELFGDRLGLLVELHHGVDDAGKLERLKTLSRRTGVAPLASQGALYHVRARKVLQDVLTAVRHKTTVAEAGASLDANAERHLHEIDELVRRFADWPQAIDNARQFADRCNFSLGELRYEYPEELAPPGQSPLEYLKRLTWEGAKQRFPEGVPERIVEKLKVEFELIEKLQYEAYFLTVHDLVRFARSKEILCQGRGSAANSVVCYCLGVTSVDPRQIDVLFSRFISETRNEAPDIDIDFEHERREEVIQYVYAKYGRQRAGMTAVTTTYRSRSAIRDVGKALGLSLDLVDCIAKNADGFHDTEDLSSRAREAGLDPQSEIGRRFVYCVEDLVGFPRHLSQHTGGMVVSRGRLDELCPIQNAAMENRTIVEWNKDDLDAIGLLKVDCLALGMLTAIRKGFDLVKQTTGKAYSLASVPEQDEATYEMIRKADTMGVFQIESRAQMSMLPRLKPRCFYDLVIEVAIVRPGPIQGEMVHPYLRRREGLEEETYPNEAVKSVLKKTLGVPLFQEQCMRLVNVAAGFSEAKTDEFRRAMAAWKRSGAIEVFRSELIDGMLANGYDRDYAERLFHQIRGFGEYGFPESHAASFALLVYVSCYIKCHYPAHFTCALLNSQPMGFYAPAQLVRDLRSHGCEVRPADVNHSGWDCRIEEEALRLGLRMVRGLSQSTGEAIEEARLSGPFVSRDDFRRRTRLPRAQLVKLAEADVFGSLGEDRRRSLWNSLAETAKSGGPSLFDLSATDDEACFALPETPLEREVQEDYRSTSLSLRSHPMAFHRQALSQLGVLPNAELVNVPHGKHVKIAGLVLVKQRPGTAKGVTFVTIEDESGVANLILHARTWQENQQVARQSAAWTVHGRVERRDSVVHVVVSRLDRLVGSLASLGVQSRNFH
ncbi:MAG TPA: error-prone DNA polymerase [Pirellulaceae bacterium]|nr:error-prone DNA polymerase [Pirellulaceae bacterium]